MTKLVLALIMLVLAIEASADSCRESSGLHDAYHDYAVPPNGPVGEVMRESYLFFDVVCEDRPRDVHFTAIRSGNGLVSELLDYDTLKPAKAGDVAVGVEEFRRDPHGVWSARHMYYYRTVRGTGDLIEGEVLLGYDSDVVGGRINEYATVKAVTCSINSPSLKINMPSVTAKDLPTLNSTYGDHSFQIDLQCPQGTQIYATLTDASDQGNRSDTLTLSNDSTASGVKLQILYKDLPVKYGPDSAEPGSSNQFYIGDSAQVSHIPLSVRYIRDGQLSSGTIRAKATYTLSYQ
ncbi:fimbrial protein [Pseudomonas synxantha]|uniref:fimbrial protein n=1 Tax=Pseudomonas synxantha TaxID=47883 RepID=UPI0013DD8E56|nr:fimbrial protein [Pseudomonas synxantha]